MKTIKYILAKFQNSLFFTYSILSYLALMGVFFWIFSYAYPTLLQLTREAAVALVTYVLTGLFMLNAYGGMDLGQKRTRQIVYSMILVIFFADLFTYILVQVTNPSIWNIWQDRKSVV